MCVFVCVCVNLAICLQVCVCVCDNLCFDNFFHSVTNGKSGGILTYRWPQRKAKQREKESRSREGVGYHTCQVDSILCGGGGVGEKGGVMRSLTCRRLSACDACTAAVACV